MPKKPKTEGLEWLIHSLMAFNGSGYADMYDAESFLDSYMTYKTVKNNPEAVLLAQRHRDAVLPTISDLLSRTYGASRQPSEKMLYKMRAQQSKFL